RSCSGEVPVELARDRGMELHHTALAELARLRADGEGAGRQIEVLAPRLARLVRAQAGCREEHHDGAVAASPRTSGRHDAGELAVRERPADVVVDLRPADLMQDRSASGIYEDALGREEVREALQGDRRRACGEGGALRVLACGGGDALLEERVHE